MPYHRRPIVVEALINGKEDAMGKSLKVKTLSKGDSAGIRALKYPAETKREQIFSKIFCLPAFVSSRILDICRSDTIIVYSAKRIAEKNEYLCYFP